MIRKNSETFYEIPSRWIKISSSSLLVINGSPKFIEYLQDEKSNRIDKSSASIKEYFRLSKIFQRYDIFVALIEYMNLSEEEILHEMKYFMSPERLKYCNTLRLDAMEKYYYFSHMVGGDPKIDSKMRLFLLTKLDLDFEKHKIERNMVYRFLVDYASESTESEDPTVIFDYLGEKFPQAVKQIKKFSLYKEHPFTENYSLP